MKKIALYGALVLALGLGVVRLCYAQAFGQVLDVAVARFYNSSGVGAFQARVNSSGNLDVMSVASAQPTGAQFAPGVQIDAASGAIRFPPYNKAQLAVLTPPTSHYVVTCTDCGSASGNIHGTAELLEISTGATQGAWTLY